MAQDDQSRKVTMEELTVSTLAMADALSKLLIAKGINTDDEFRTQLQAERANYLAVVKRLHLKGGQRD
jgi:hypothetical protein